jgi:hypothetical protein
VDAHEIATRIVTTAVRNHFHLADDLVIDTHKTFADFDADDLDPVEIEMAIEELATEEGMHFHLDTEMHAANTIQDLIEQTARKVSGHFDPNGSWNSCSVKIDAIEEHMRALRRHLLAVKNNSVESERWLRTTSLILDETASAIKQVVAPGEAA